MKTLIALLVVLVAPCAAQESVKRTTLDKLSNLKVSLDFTNQPLDDVISYLRDLSGLNFHVDNDVRAKFTEEQLKVTIKVKDLPLKSALKLVLGSRDLTATYKEATLVIKTKAEAAPLATKVYDVRDLSHAVQDFPGPVMDLSKDRSGIIIDPGFPTDREPTFTDEFLTDLVKSSTGERSWDEGGASMTMANGMLIVAQSAACHREIEQFLNKLRSMK